jgi:hypothetical protein
MICRLFIFSEETALNLDVDQVHKECKHCKGHDKCIMSDEVNIPLTEAKYSWTISKKLKLPSEYEDKTKLYGFQSAIRLIEASTPNIWIVQMMNDDEYVYSILVGKSKTGCKSISQLNYTLRNNHKYDGRDLTVEDFEFNG